MTGRGGRPLWGVFVIAALRPGCGESYGANEPATDSAGRFTLRIDHGGPPRKAISIPITVTIPPTPPSGAADRAHAAARPVEPWEPSLVRDVRVRFGRIDRPAPVTRLALELPGVAPESVPTPPETTLAGLAYGARAEVAGAAPRQLHVSFSVVNTAARARHLEWGACSLRLRAYRAGEGGAPVWRSEARRPVGSETPYVCPLYLATGDLAPGDSMRAGELQAYVSVPEILADSLPAGRYHITALMELNDRWTPELSAGDVYLDPAVDPLPDEREIDSVVYRAAVLVGDGPRTLRLRITATNRGSAPATIGGSPAVSCPVLLYAVASRERRDRWYVPGHAEAWDARGCPLEIPRVTIAPGETRTFEGVVGTAGGAPDSTAVGRLYFIAGLWLANASGKVRHAVLSAGDADVRAVLRAAPVGDVPPGFPPAFAPGRASGSDTTIGGLRYRATSHLDTNGWLETEVTVTNVSARPVRIGWEFCAVAQRLYRGPALGGAPVFDWLALPGTGCMQYLTTGRAPRAASRARPTRSSWARERWSCGDGGRRPADTLPARRYHGAPRRTPASAARVTRLSQSHRRGQRGHGNPHADRWLPRRRARAGARSHAGARWAARDRDPAGHVRALHHAARDHPLRPAPRR
ncbi:MAG TPA: hypothetical protein VFS44_10965, partial [Gemmatimonadaceae bacterium]|nr:hypothetical protein [Gemmatimonadaceae bacterium]